MKKVLLLNVLAILFANGVTAQVVVTEFPVCPDEAVPRTQGICHTFDTNPPGNDFASAATAGQGWAGSDAITISYDGVNKRVVWDIAKGGWGSWAYVQWWIQGWNYNFVANPYMRFKVRADRNINLSIRPKDTGGKQVDVSVPLRANVWEDVFLDFSDNLGEITQTLSEIQIDPGNGGDGTLTVKLEWDYFALGAPARPYECETSMTALTDEGYSSMFTANHTGFVPTRVADTGNDVGGSATFSHDAVNGYSVWNMTKNGGWSFLQWFWNPRSFNFTLNPYIRFKVRADKTFNLNISIQDKKTPDPRGSTDVAVSLVANEWKEVLLDFSNHLGTINPALAVYQINFDPGAIGAVKLEWDYMVIGKPANPNLGIAKPTGYTADFNSGLPDELKSNSSYGITSQDNAARVSVGRNTRWTSFEFNLGKLYDFSAQPWINVKVKADDPFILQAFMFDANGNGYELYETGSQYRYNELRSYSFYQQARVLKGDEFINVFFDLSGAATVPPSANRVNLSEITKIIFVCNGTAQAWSGSFMIDDLLVGDAASKFAYAGQPAPISYMKDTEGDKELLFPELRNVASLALSGSSTLLENIAFTTPSYTVVQEQHSSASDRREQRYGNAKMTYKVKSGVSGSETLTVNLTGESGFAPATVKIKVSIRENQKPTIQQLDPISVAVDAETTVVLKNISDGNADTNMKLTFTPTSSNAAVIENSAINITRTGQFANMKLKAKDAGTSNVSIKVTDELGLDSIMTFELNAFKALNKPPTIDEVTSFVVYNNVTEQIVTLTGISDGDRSNQPLEVSVSLVNETVCTATVEYTDGDETAQLKVVPKTAASGSVDATVTVQDKGGNPDNDGDKSTSITFRIIVSSVPVTGHIVPNGVGLNPDNSSIIGITSVEFGGGTVFKLDLKDKIDWDGFSLSLTGTGVGEMDLTDYPLISYEVYPVDDDLYHWNYFWAATGDGYTDRNIANSTSHMMLSPKGQWTELVFDYRHEGDMNTAAGNPIDASRIHNILFNIHEKAGSWPNSNYTGVCYYRNIKIGDEVTVAPIVPACTIDRPADVSVFQNAGTMTMTLTGISGGLNDTDGISMSTTATGALTSSVVYNNNGTATLTIGNIATANGSVTVNVNKQDATQASITLQVRVVAANVEEEEATLTVNKSDTHQTIRGFGTFYNSPRHAELYANDWGASAMRIGIIESGWENVNDNDDPYVMNMDGFNYNCIDWDYLRDLKERGVETFILTSWSPPAWMKRNLAEASREGSTAYANNDNILEPYYYEEFAESMAAFAIAFKERVGIDLAGIGLQNEPGFTEPYASAVLGGPQWVELINVVGERFKKEGLEHVGLFMPEQVFGNSGGGFSCVSYLASVQGNAEADAYTTAFAVHGYDGNGTGSNFPTYPNWKTYYDAAQATANKKEMWMTETELQYSGWQSALNLAGALHGSLWVGNISLWTNWAFESMQLTKNIPNSSFYTSKNFFKYIRPGYKRVDTQSNSGRALVSAYVSPDGDDFTAVVLNTGAALLSAHFAGADLPGKVRMYRTSQYENFVDLGVIDIANGANFLLPPSSVTTFTYQKAEFEDHQITVIGGTADPISAPMGTVVTITADNLPDHAFYTWISDDDITFANARSATTTFVMPAGDVTIEAVFIAVGIDEYTVTVNGGFADPVVAKKDVSVDITAVIPAGKEFVRWESSDGITFVNANAAETTFTMPEKNVTVTAIFKNIVYSITIIGGTGPAGGEEGETITITANTPDEGKKFDKWTSDGNDVTFEDEEEAETTFTMPGRAVTVTATFTSDDGIDDAANAVMLYPNPASGSVTVNILDADLGTIKIFDATGSLVFTAQLNEGENRIDVSKLAEGIYLLQVSGSSKEINKTLIIK